jgi:hypothetical protein
MRDCINELTRGCHLVLCHTAVIVPAPVIAKRFICTCELFSIEIRKLS